MRRWLRGAATTVADPLRVVVDTNVLISGLPIPGALPALVVRRWRDGRFTLGTSSHQIDEIRRVSRYPRVQERLSPQDVGRLVNAIRRLAVVVEPLLTIDVSPDADDNAILGACAAGHADVLVTGDKQHLLSLVRFRGTHITTVRDFLTITLGGMSDPPR